MRPAGRLGAQPKTVTDLQHAALVYPLKEASHDSDGHGPTGRLRP